MHLTPSSLISNSTVKQKCCLSSKETIRRNWSQPSSVCENIKATKLNVWNSSLPTQYWWFSGQEQNYEDKNVSRVVTSSGIVEHSQHAKIRKVNGRAMYKFLVIPRRFLVVNKRDRIYGFTKIVILVKIMCMWSLRLLYVLMFLYLSLFTNVI